MLITLTFRIILWPDITWDLQSEIAKPHFDIDLSILTSLSQLINRDKDAVIMGWLKISVSMCGGFVFYESQEEISISLYN